MATDFAENFFTISGEKVLRGMHFQMPPADHAKLVYCVAGAVMDVGLDLRVGSPTFGEHFVIELSAERNNAVYMPEGVAHGFYVREGPAVMIYNVGSEHSPTLDAGILWQSFGACWPEDAPVISARDSRLPALSEFQSPFRYTAEPGE